MSNELSFPLDLTMTGRLDRGLSGAELAVDKTALEPSGGAGGPSCWEGLDEAGSSALAFDSFIFLHFTESVSGPIDPESFTVIVDGSEGTVITATAGGTGHAYVTLALTEPWPDGLSIIVSYDGEGGLIRTSTEEDVCAFDLTIDVES